MVECLVEQVFVVHHEARQVRVDPQPVRAELGLEPLAAELSGILNWVEQLQEIDTSDVPPMTSVRV
jgi:hypothetical protein